MRRTLYLVLFAAVVAVLAAAGYYLRHRAATPAAATAGAGCDTPAPPPPSKPSDPKLPDFLEAGCGPGGSASKPAPAVAPKK
jgi:hypothetical protein